MAAETVMAVPCFACYDSTTRVAEFEFAGENFEALELSVEGSGHASRVAAGAALELLPGFIESLLQHVMDVRQDHGTNTEVGGTAGRETGAVAEAEVTISGEQRSSHAVETQHHSLHPRTF